MCCPKCKQKTKVIDTRPMSPGNGVRRRRECVKCKHRFTTYEEFESSENLEELIALREKLRCAKLNLAIAEDILTSDADRKKNNEE